jgi:hypothetical protein
MADALKYAKKSLGSSPFQWLGECRAGICRPGEPKAIKKKYGPICHRAAFHGAAGDFLRIILNG